MSKQRKHIFFQMFDIRPNSKSGQIDLEKIMRVKRVLDLQAYFRNPEKEESIKFIKEGVKKVSGFDELDTEEKKVAFLVKSRSFYKIAVQKRKKRQNYPNISVSLKKTGEKTLLPPQFYADKAKKRKISDILKSNAEFYFGEALKFIYARKLFFLIPLAAVLIIVSFAAVFQNKNVIKRKIKDRGMVAYEKVLKAKEAILEMDFSLAKFQFKEAQKEFSAAKKEAGYFGTVLFSVSKKLPFEGEIKTGANLIELGERLAKIGESLSGGLEELSFLEFNSFFEKDQKNKAFLPAEILKNFVLKFQESIKEIEDIEINLDKIDSDKIPEKAREQIKFLKEKIPEIKKRASGWLAYAFAIQKAIGADKKQVYLLAFQNPSELRATGGFVGSYGIIEIDRGVIVKIFVDDVFNIDGQLVDKIIPPKPVQRVSTAWSTHDSNWFFDFVESAKKMALFYERAGGQTPDAVLAINSNVLKTILKIVGPVDMPEYGVIIEADNFEEIVQYKVEEDFDKGLNRPKQILTDLTLKIISKMKDIKKEEMPNLFSAFSELFAKKDIMVFSKDGDIQEILDGFGVSGRVVETEGDYLAVVHSNLGGYKTDKMIDEKISFLSDISENGSIINTVKIIRAHKGGKSGYEWYNKVNTDYLRVYVPKGSILLSASGHTIDDFSLNFDYQKAHFEADEDILSVENSEIVDPKSGTQIFEESGKTVFGNWIFLSPGEIVEVVYSYRLPFNFQERRLSSVYFQKQSGTNSDLEVKIFGNKIFRGKWDKDIEL